MKNNTIPYSLRAERAWLDEVKAVAAEHNMSVTELMTVATSHYINILKLQDKLLEEDQTPLKKYLLVRYNNDLMGSVSVYEDEQVAIDDSKLAWSKLTKEQKANMMLFNVCEAVATQAQFMAIQEQRLEAAQFITKTIKSYEV